MVDNGRSELKHVTRCPGYSASVLMLWGQHSIDELRRLVTSCLAAMPSSPGCSAPRAEARVCRKARGASNTRMTFSSEPAAYRNRETVPVGMLATQLKACPCTFHAEQTELVTTQHQVTHLEGLSS